MNRNEAKIAEAILAATKFAVESECEACAKEADEWAEKLSGPSTVHSDRAGTARAIARSIRARRQGVPV